MQNLTMHLHDYNLVPQCEQLQPPPQRSTIADFATVQQQTFMSIISQEKKKTWNMPVTGGIWVGLVQFACYS